MEVSQHHVNDPELIAWQDKKRRWAARRESSSGLRSGFKSPDTGRPNRHDPPPGFFRSIDLPGDFGFYFAPLGVNGVLIHIIFGHRRKSIQPHVQRDMYNLHTFGF